MLKPEILVVLSSFVGLLVMGCSRGPEFAEVEGRVTFNDEPLDVVEVVFLPDPDKGSVGNRSSAYTDADGRYRLQTPRDGRSGTIVGTHRVCIIDIKALPDLGPPENREGDEKTPTTKKPNRSRVSACFNSPLETPLTDVEVKVGKQTIDFNLPLADDRRR